MITRRRKISGRTEQFRFFGKTPIVFFESLPAGGKTFCQSFALGIGGNIGIEIGIQPNHPRKKLIGRTAWMMAFAIGSDSARNETWNRCHILKLAESVNQPPDHRPCILRFLQLIPPALSKQIESGKEPAVLNRRPVTFGVRNVPSALFRSRQNDFTFEPAVIRDNSM